MDASVVKIEVADTEARRDRARGQRTGSLAGGCRAHRAGARYEGDPVQHHVCCSIDCPCASSDLGIIKPGEVNNADELVLLVHLSAHG